MRFGRLPLNAAPENSLGLASEPFLSNVLIVERGLETSRFSFFTTTILGDDEDDDDDDDDVSGEGLVSGRISLARPSRESRRAADA